MDQGNEGDADGPSILPYTKGMPMVLTKNTHSNIGLVNGKEGKTVDVVLDEASQIYHVDENVCIVDRPAAAIFLKPYSQ